MASSTTTDTYQTCLSDLSATSSNGSSPTSDALLQCISSSFDAQTASTHASINTFFLLYAATLVFFMQAGFAMVSAGCVRTNNVQNTLLKNLLDACGAALGFYTVGYAFAWGGSLDTATTERTFIGTQNFFLMDVDSSQDSFWLFQLAFCSASATIVAGTLAERCQMVAYLAYSMTLAGFVYPVVVHSIWSPSGFLSATRETDLFLDVGMIDFAGSTVVHLTGGMTALIATIVLGPRTGRFYDLRGNPLKVPKEFPGHSLALQMLGVFILWFGWYGFNAGSILNITNDLNHTIVSHTAINTTLAASAGSIMTLFLSTVVAERFTGEIVFSLSYAMNGCLSGLVAITAGCSVVEHWAAIIIGLVGGALYLACSKLLVKKRIDDAVDGIPVHLINGIWGTLSVGLFAVPELLEQVYGRGDHAGWFYSWGQGSADAKLLGAQVVGILFVSGWVMITMFPFFCFLHYVGWLRADSLEEVVGLDAAYSQGVLQTRARAQSEEENMEHYISEYVKQREEKAFIKKINSNSTHGRTILGASMHSMNIINSSMHSRKDSLPRAIESLNNSRHSGSRGSRSINDIAIDNSHGQSEDGLAAPDEGSA
eukprot:g11606.t1 g11606   contig6:199603-201681(-)